jgi:hypothetical protein
MKKEELTPEIVEQIKESYIENGSIRSVERELKSKIDNITFHNIRDVINSL